jgi:hypothetical protein
MAIGYMGSGMVCGKDITTCRYYPKITNQKQVQIGLHFSSENIIPALSRRKKKIKAATENSSCHYSLPLYKSLGLPFKYLI